MRAAIANAVTDVRSVGRVHFVARPPSAEPGARSHTHARKTHDGDDGDDGNIGGGATIHTYCAGESPRHAGDLGRLF